jgi:hypothetical protein
MCTLQDTNMTRTEGETRGTNPWSTGRSGQSGRAVIVECIPPKFGGVVSLRRGKASDDSDDGDMKSKTDLAPHATRDDTTAVFCRGTKAACSFSLPFSLFRTLAETIASPIRHDAS